MESILDRPLVASQCQHAGGIGPFWREAGDPIHELLRTLERMFDASAHAKDLPHAGPVARQEVIEFGGDGDQAVFEASMSFGGGRSAAPIAAIQWRLTKKEREIFTKSR